MTDFWHDCVLIIVKFQEFKIKASSFVELFDDDDGVILFIRAPQ